MTTRPRAHIENAPTTSVEREPIELGERTVESEILIGLDRERDSIRPLRMNVARTTRPMMIAQGSRERLGGPDSPGPIVPQHSGLLLGIRDLVFQVTR
jgi:hypothetical protein